MAQLVHRSMRSCRALVTAAVVVLVIGVALNENSSRTALAWSFGTSPTKAFATDGFAGVSGDGSGESHVLEDASGNIFRVGSTAGTFDVDPGTGTTLVGNGVADPVHYVAKYSSSGDLMWAHDWKPVGSSELYITTASVGPGGYIVLGGYVAATAGMDIDPTGGVDSVTTATFDPLIMRLNADGTYGWGTSFPVTGGGGGDVNSLSVSATGVITAAIRFENTLSLFGTPIVSAGGNDAAIVRFDSSLSSMTWNTTIKGSTNEFVASLDVSLDGKVFVSGGFASASITVTGSDAAGTTVTRSGSASVNSYVTSISNTGVVQYAVPHSIGATDNYPRSAVLSSAGVLLLQLDAGELVEVSTTGVITSRGTITANIMDMTYLSTGEIVAVGIFSSTADFDPSSGVQTRTSAGSNDGFVLRLTSALAFTAVQVFATITLDELRTVVPSVSGGYLVSGRSFHTSLNLSNTEYPGTYTRSASADSFSFVIFYDAASTSGVPTTTTVPAVTAPTRVSYTTGNKKVTLTWSAVSGAASYTVFSASGTTLCSVSSTSCVVSSLKNGKIYTFTVKSVNSASAVSTNSTAVRLIPGFTLKGTTFTVKKTPLLTSIVTTPSKGARRWAVTSGKCVLRSGRLVAPKTAGSCRLKLTVSKWSRYPAMTTTVSVSVTR